MSKDSKELTYFFTRFGSIKYLEKLFGLCNSLASLQYLINNILYDFLYPFVQTYLNHIIMYNKTPENHSLPNYKLFERWYEVGI